MPGRVLVVVGLALLSLRCGSDGGPITVPEDPFIGLSETIKSFSGTEGAAGPAAQTVAITNVGEGTLSGLATAVSYTSGPAEGWLTAELSATTAPSTLTLTASTGGLAPGSYTASVAVSSAVANNSPQAVGVNFTVQPEAAGATIVLSSSSQNFSTLQGGPNPPAQTVEVSNGGGGSLGGLTADVTYTTGQPGGWLTAGLSSTAAPSILTLAAAAGSLTAGTYTASVAIGSAAADNSPQTLGVTFTIVPPTAGPIISLSTSSRNFSATQAGANPGPRNVEISNGGGGTLSGLETAISFTAGQPVGWLAASLSATTAPSTLRLTATTGSLAVGTYAASVAVTSGVADNSPQPVNVTFTVRAAPQITLSSSSQTFSVLQGGGNPAAQTVEVSNGGGGTLSGLTTEISYTAGQLTGWLNADLSRATAPSTLTLTVTTGTLTAGTYNASVAVRSAVASNSPQPVSIIFTVTLPAPEAPSGLVATAGSNSQISLTWTDNASNEEGFRIERCTNVGCTDFTELATVDADATDYLDGGLNESTTYRYQVRAYNSGGNSAYSEIATATTLSSWTTKAPMTTPRFSAASGVVNGILYVVGGTFGDLAANEAYDPVTDTWSPKAAMPTPRRGPAAAVVSGILYVVGGFREGLGNIATVEAYDPATDAWTTKAPMPTARAGAMVGVVGGILYVAGGSVPGTGFLTTVEAYNPATDSWTTRAPLSVGRIRGAGGVVNGIFYVAGGDAGGGSFPATTEAYDPTTDRWTTKATIPTQRDGVASAVLDGILYVAGGDLGGGTVSYSPTVEAYNPATDSWTTKSAMPTPRYSPAAGVVNEVFYVVGGRATSGHALGTLEAYSP